MLVDPDVIGIIIALFAFTATVLGGVSRMLAKQSRGLDTRLDSIDERFTRLETQITELRVELKGDVAELRTELKGDISGLRVELKTEIADVKTELKADIADVRVSIARLEGPLPKLQRI
jgi:predicted  nucleic acid-binding Zn-ribbon protein